MCNRSCAERGCRVKKKNLTPRHRESRACRKIRTTVHLRGPAHLRGIIIIDIIDLLIKSNDSHARVILMNMVFGFQGRRAGLVEHGHIYRAHGFGNIALYLHTEYVRTLKHFVMRFRRTWKITWTTRIDWTASGLRFARTRRNRVRSAWPER